jgi:GAF domain-containing protein
MVDMWTTEILYSASSQLTAARTPWELLDAAIVYARVRGAAYAQLIYITGDTVEEARGVVMAEWRSPNDSATAPAGFTIPFADPQDETAYAWMAAPDAPFLVSDVHADPRLSEQMRLCCADHQQVSVAVLPMHNQDRWVGALVFGWMRPYTFTDRDARIFTAVIGNVAPVINSIRLMEESRERAQRAEYLLRISDALSKATDEGDILRALALYTDTQGGDMIALNYVADEHGDDPFPYEPIAWLAQGEVHYYRDETLPSARLADFGIKDLWALNPDDLLIISDIAEETRLTPKQRAGILESTPVRALVVLPLQAGGVFQGLFGIVWMQPHTFGEQELYIYHQLQQLLPSIVASRRAYLAEQAARYESEVLYRASAGVNAALTFEDVLNALAELPLGGHGVAMSLMEHFDREQATYSELIQRSRTRAQFQYRKVMHSELEFDDETANLDQLVTADVTQDPRFDEKTRAHYLRSGMRAVCDVILRVGSRVLGYFVVYDTQPRTFSVQQKRLIAGIGDLAANAVERIRLQQATELARQRAELISRINAALVRAKDEAAILQAIADYTSSVGADYIGLNYAVGDGIADVRTRDSSERIARWESGTIRYFKDDTTPQPRFTEFGVPSLWAAHPDRVLLIEDFEGESRLSEDNRRKLLAAMRTRATAIIPLYTGAVFQGLVNVSWHAPHSFSDEERFVFHQLQQVLPAVVATRRAYLSEQSARGESEILYRAGDAINAAMTFDDLLNAMIQLPLTSEGVVLSLYENFELKDSAYLEIRARRRDAPEAVSDRLTLEMFPHMRDYAHENIRAVADVANDPALDPVTRQTFARMGIGAFISVPLRAGDRTYGFISFVNQNPSAFTLQQQRLAAGMSDLVANAVERIRLQIASDQARRRAEILQRMNAELLRATDEAGMLYAIAAYGSLQGAARIGLSYAVADQTPDISASDAYERIARWDAPGTIVYYRDDPREEPRLAPFGVPKLWADRPYETFYVEDYGTDDRLTPEQRAGIVSTLAFRASAIIPLFAGSNFQGLLSLHWTTPHTFTDEERHVCDQLRQVMPAVVASRRAYLAEQTARQESEILYRAGEQVNAAYTLEGLAATIAQLPLTVNGVLLGVFDTFDAETASHVDVLRWLAQHGAITHERFALAQFPLLRDYARRPFGVIEDLSAAVDLDATTRSAFAERDSKSYVSVGLTVGERTLGFLTFCDNIPRKFSPAQRRLAAGVGDMVSNAVERIRLQAVTDRARVRAELLSSISNALLQATDEATIVQAVAEYGESLGALQIGLTYAVSDDVRDISTPEAYTRVARWERPGRLVLDPVELELGLRLAQFGVGALWAAHTDRVLYVEDYTTDERISPEHREAIKESVPLRASAIIPLFARGTFQGMLGFHFGEPHAFSADERYVFERLRLVLPAVVGTRRAYLAEQSARHESEVLYRAGESVNAANTFEDLLEAIAELPLAVEAVSLSLYEDMDAEDSTYLDVLVRHKGAADVMRERLTIEQFPQMRAYASLAYLTIEDVLDDPNTDLTTQRMFAERGLRSFIGTSLRAGGRTLGLLTFFDSLPRQFSQQQLRLAIGMADLVVTAVERIRLQSMTDQARRRAESLSRVNAALLRSTDEAQILEAIAEYAAARGAEAVGLYYSDDTGGESLDTVPVARWQGGVVQAHQAEAMLTLTDLGVQTLWQRGRDHVQLVEDFANEPRLPQRRRSSILRDTPVRALAVIPLYTTGSFQGALVVFFHETHVFSEEETHLYAQLQQVLPAVVATRRAYLAEQSARYESEVLYRAGKAINASHTYEDLLKAVAELKPPGNGISIGLFENFDERNAAYMDITARAVESEQLHRERLSVDTFPLARTLPPHGVLVITAPHSDERIDARSRAVFAKWGLQSLISVSLMIGEQYLGILTFHDTRPRRYSIREQHIAAGVADLVANAVERIALRMETEAGRYRAETISELHTALSRAVDEPSILGALAGYVEARGGTAMLLRYADMSDNYTTVRSWGVASWYRGTQPLAGEAAGPDERPYFDVGAWWGDRLDEVLVLEDIAQATAVDEEARQRFLRVYSARAMAVLPLVSGGVFQGALAIFWDRPHAFSEDELYIFRQLMRTLPSVVATRRALLAEQQRAQQLEAVARVSSAVSGSLTRSELIRTVTRLAQGGFADHHFTLFLLDEGSQTLEQQVDGEPGEPGCSIPLSEAKSMVAEAARTLRGVYVDDLAASDRYSLRAFFPDARSEMAVPMAVGGQLIGVLDVQSRVVQRYTHPELLVMHTLADLVAVAIQNIRLYEQAQEAAAYEERNRLARELHDSVSQALYGIALGARTARALLDRSPERLQQPLDYILSLADVGLMEMRALIFDLRVDSIQEEGLIAALSKQTASIGARHNITMDTEFCSEPALSIEVKEALYWIAREALHNIIKHAQAKHVSVRVIEEPDALRLEIVDDGLGFDAEHDFRGHMGLKNLRERSARLNGTLDIATAPGQGTAIRIRVPISREQEGG